MTREDTTRLLHRRTLLQQAGLGTLALAGLTATGIQPARAAGERTRFVSTWNAPDMLDPHVKYDVSAAAVHFSFTRLLTLGKAPAGIFKRMGLTPEKIHVRDPHTVEFRLDQPRGPFRVAIPLVSIVNPLCR